MHMGKIGHKTLIVFWVVGIKAPALELTILKLN